MLKRPSLDSVRPKSENTRRSCPLLSDSGYLTAFVQFLYSILSLLNRCLLLTTIFYLLVIAGISLAVDTYGQIPKSYFSNKHNVLNQYFVKLGWGWTLLLISAFVGLTSYIKSGGSLKSVFKNLLRMVGGTACWYVNVNLIEYIHATSGFCGKSFAWDLSKCKPQDVRRVDISGHTFLLLFCILVMLEELRVFEGWSSAPKKGAARNIKSIEKARRLHSQFTVVVNVLLLFVVALFVLWHVMLFSTALYFHDMLQKVLGGLLAIAGWTILYNVIYKILSIPPPS